MDSPTETPSITNGASSISPALAQAEELVHQQDAVRAALLKERSVHVAILERIDAALARLSVAEKQPPKASARAEGAANGRSYAVRAGTIPSLLLSIIAASPGITSAAIIAAAKKKRPKLEGPDVFANLYRLQKRGLIRTEGPRGAMRYYPAGPTAKEAAGSAR